MKYQLINRFANIRQLPCGFFQVMFGNEKEGRYQFGYFQTIEEALAWRNEHYKKKKRYHRALMYTLKKKPGMNIRSICPGSKSRVIEEIISSSYYKIHNHERTNKQFNVKNYKSEDDCIKAAFAWELGYRRQFNHVVRIANKLICQSAEKVADLELETLTPQFSILYKNKHKFWSEAYQQWLIKSDEQTT